MRYLLHIALGIALLVTYANAQVKIRGTAVVLDSLAANPTKPTTGRVEYFSKGGHLYQMLSDSSTTRVDSAGVNRNIGFAWYAVSAVDSVRLFEAPASATIDSIRVIRTGGTSASVNLKRDRASSFSDLLSANYATTTSMATPTGLQNSSLNKNDVIWISIRAISGTVTELLIQVNYH